MANENELLNNPRIPRRMRINLKTGVKEVHIFTDEEILEFVKTGKVELPEDAEWIEVKR